MARRVLIDTGPLVALIDRRDENHRSALNFIERFVGQLYSTVAVLTETMYLLDFSIEAQQDFLTWVHDGAVTRIDLDNEDFAHLIRLHNKYADRPMDFADATLVAVADGLQIREIATFDSDFRIYQYRGRYAFNLPLMD